MKPYKKHKLIKCVLRNCFNPTAGGRHGLCKWHYREAAKRVRIGLQKWEILEEMGLARPKGWRAVLRKTKTTGYERHYPPMKSIDDFDEFGNLKTNAPLAGHLDF